jgi:hypothetical protein
MVFLDREGKVTSTPGPGARPVFRYQPVDEAAYKQARSEFWAYNNWGAGIVAFWLILIFLIMLGFSYSFFWCAATMIYLLMRKRVDEAELDEVFLEDEEPEPPLAPPKIAEGTATTSLPVILPSASDPPMPPLPHGTQITSPQSPPPPTPPAAETLPFSPPPPPPPEPPRKDEGPGG